MNRYSNPRDAVHGPRGWTFGLGGGEGRYERESRTRRDDPANYSSYFGEQCEI